MTTNEFPTDIIIVNPAPKKPTAYGDEYRAALRCGRPWLANVMGSRPTYHRSKDAAVKAACARARRACPGNPPVPQVAKLVWKPLILSPALPSGRRHAAGPEAEL
jgi:hypothetical protein